MRGGRGYGEEYSWKEEIGLFFRGYSNNVVYLKK